MKQDVPLLDLHGQFRSIEPEIRAALERVFATQQFILGPEVDALEKEVAAYVGCSHGIGVTSGSDALILALMGLGVGPGDEVLTVPYTFFATVGAISRVGAKPVFVDIDETSFNMNAMQAVKALGPKTKAVIPVHLFGQSAEMDPLMEACQAKGIPVIEDAAQAIGTEYKGRRLGSIGKIGCFSFFPSKNLGAMGDAGMVTTNDAGLAERMKILRSHGSKPKYFHKFVGGNFRIDALQAAVLRAKFKHLDDWTKKRQENASRYDRLFKDAGLTDRVRLPWRRQGDRHIFNQYVICVDQRDALKTHLQNQGVHTEIYYPRPMHLQECFAELGHGKGAFPVSERAAETSLAIPVYPELQAPQQEYVVEQIGTFFKN